MDGEVKLWLAQQEVREEEATGVDVLGEGEEGVMEEEILPSDQQQEPAQPTVVG